jgi:MoaA/NifB/PqqE/SkfB family radical SAM enzyme
VNRACLLVITGGEPLVRPDILDIARQSRRARETGCSSRCTSVRSR